jgi:histidyl-tRNA synthetase
MAKQDTQPARGTRDFLPSEARRRAHVIALVREVFERHGFEPLETPAIERLGALLGKYGEEGDQLLFKVLLRGQPLVDGIRQAAEKLSLPGGIVAGRSGETAPGAEPLLADLGLRYDLTVPLARVYAAHRSKLPGVFKRYQIQPVWRADTPGKGRFREFLQCDVDVVGSTSPLAETEVLCAATVCMEKLGFREFAIRLNHRALLRAVCEVAGVPPALEGTAIVAIDKLDKVGRDGVAAELRERGVSDPARLLEALAARDLDEVSRVVAGHAAGAAAVANLREVVGFLGATPVGAHVRFDASLARGLGYYTGAIFEIQVPDLAGALAGGGRYDGLVGSFAGQSVPAVGCSLGLERILTVLEERGALPGEARGLDVVVAAADASDLHAALALATRLRAGGLRADLWPEPLSPGKLRKHADERGIPAAAWLERGARDRASLWIRAGGATRSDAAFDEIVAGARAASGATP